MYCPDCNHLTEEARCPVCRNRELREPEAGDPCFLAELEFIQSGIIEDMLKQNGIPYLKKDVMGAGLAIKVGPMLERSRFYVSFEQLERAMSIVEELFAESGETDADEMSESLV